MVANRILTQSCLNNVTCFDNIPYKLTNCKVTVALNPDMTLPHIGKDINSKTPGVFVMPLKTIENYLEINFTYVYITLNGEYRNLGKKRPRKLINLKKLHFR